MPVWCRVKKCDYIVDGTHCCYDDGDIGRHGQCRRYRRLGGKRGTYPGSLGKVKDPVEYYIMEQWQRQPREDLTRKERSECKRSDPRPVRRGRKNEGVQLQESQG